MTSCIKKQDDKCLSYFVKYVCKVLVLSFNLSCNVTSVKRLSVVVFTFAILKGTLPPISKCKMYLLLCKGRVVSTVLSMIMTWLNTCLSYYCTRDSYARHDYVMVIVFIWKLNMT